MKRLVTTEDGCAIECHDTRGDKIVHSVEAQDTEGDCILYISYSPSFSGVAVRLSDKNTELEVNMYAKHLLPALKSLVEEMEKKNETASKL